MSRTLFIAGCGEMMRSTYEEMMAAVDRAYARPRDEPLPSLLSPALPGPEAVAPKSRAPAVSDCRSDAFYVI